MAFRIQDLMMDVRPGGLQMGGLQMANPECTCQVTVKPGVQRMPEPLDPRKGPAPEDEPPCEDIPRSRECPPDSLKALATELAVLRNQLRRDLGQSA